MTPSVYAVRHPFWPGLAIVLAVLLGVFAALRLPQTHLPDLGLDRLELELVAPGLDLVAMQAKVVRPAEAALGGLDGISGISVISVAGSARILLELADPGDLPRLQPEVEDRLQKLRADADGAITAHAVTAHSGRTTPLRVLSVTSTSMPPGALGQAIRENWYPALARLPGVGDVRIEGDWRPGLTITVDPLRLSALGMTPTDFYRLMPSILSGTAVAPSEDRLGLASANPRPSDLPSLPILLADGTKIALGEVAELQMEDVPPETLHRQAQDLAVRLTILPAVGVDVPTAAAEVDALLAQLLADTPDTQVTLIDDGAALVTQSLGGTVRALLEGCLLVIFVVGLALRSWRATFIAALALPLSILPTLAVLEVLGITLNLISLLGLTLAAGLLVDDAIVEVENIQRRLSAGLPPLRAAETGAEALGRAVVATTFAIVAVFLPVAFMPGLAGRYFFDFGITISVAALISLLVARLVVPAIAGGFLRPSQKQSAPRRTSFLKGCFVWILEFALDRPFVVCVLLAGLTIPAADAIMQRPGTFIPEDKQSRMSFAVILPADSSQLETDAKLSILAGQVASMPGVNSVRTLAGLPGDGPHVGQIDIDLTDDVSAVEMIEIDKLVQRQPDGVVMRLSSNGKPRLSLKLASVEATPLSAGLLHQALGRLASDPQIAEVHSPGSAQRAVLSLTAEPGTAASFNLDRGAMTDYLALADRNKAGNLPDLILPDGQVLEVRFFVGGAEVDPLAALLHPLPDGGVIPIGSLVHSSLTLEPLTVERRNGAPVFPVWVEPAMGVVPSQAMRATHSVLSGGAWLEDANLVAAPSGAEEQRGHMMSAMTWALTLSALILGATLMALFRSMSRVAVILLTLPLALVGTFSALSQTGLTVSLPVLLGVMLCLGLVSKNAILILDAAQRHEQSGEDPREAMFCACLERTRPVLMTSFAMIAGMAPAAFGQGEGAEFRQPLAITVMAGIGSATVLGLIAVPALDRLAGWIWPRRPYRVGRLVRGTRSSRPSQEQDLFDMQGRTPK